METICVIESGNCNGVYNRWTFRYATNSQYGQQLLKKLSKENPGVIYRIKEIPVLCCDTELEVFHEEQKRKSVTDKLLDKMDEGDIHVLKQMGLKLP